MTVIPFPSRRRYMPSGIGEWIDFAAHLIVFGCFACAIILFCMVL